MRNLNKHSFEYILEGFYISFQTIILILFFFLFFSIMGRELQDDTTYHMIHIPMSSCITVCLIFIQIRAHVGKKE